jgi:putative membrane protein
MKLLTEEEKKQIESAVKKAESMTSGEIVFAIADASGRYHHATLEAALLCMAIVVAVYLLLPVPHTLAYLILVELASFFLFESILPYFPWRRWLISKKQMADRVQEAAFMQFYTSGLFKTRESNGIEIFLSVFERKVVVIADRGINEKMGEQHWTEVRDLIIRGIKEGKACAGICAAIEDCGRALAQHFPHRPDDVNELPDGVVRRPLK